MSERKPVLIEEKVKQVTEQFECGICGMSQSLVTPENAGKVAYEVANGKTKANQKVQEALYQIVCQMQWGNFDLPERFLRAVATVLNRAGAEVIVNEECKALTVVFPEKP